MAAGFDEDDIADLCAPEHDESVLERCMGTLARSIRAEHARLDAALAACEAAWPDAATHGAARAAAAPVRCADCRHFRRRTSHPRLGDCAAGATRTAAGGFWDEQWRGCAVFAPAPDGGRG